jgi:hypothetical protein
MSGRILGVEGVQSLIEFSFLQNFLLYPGYLLLGRPAPMPFKIRTPIAWSTHLVVSPGVLPQLDKPISMMVLEHNYL